MWSAKDRQQRPPTPRWNPSIIVSPTTSLLHQRRSNPKAGRHNTFLGQNLLSESNYSDPPYQQQHDYLQTPPSLTSSFVTEHLADIQQDPTSTSQRQQLQQTLPTTVNPRHVSFATQPDHTVHSSSLLAMHSPLSQVSFAQPNSRTREPTPLSSLSFSPTLASSQWDSQDVSPLPHRSHTDSSDQSAVDWHVADESDSCMDVGLSSSSSAAPRVVRPVITSGKCPRPQYCSKNLTLIRPSRLSFVETAGSSDDQSSSSPQTPVSGILPSHGSLSTRKRTAYPGSTSSSSSSTTPSSVTLSPFSDEPQTEMDLLVRQYNIGIERQLEVIMNEKLPRLFKDCGSLVRSMTETPQLISTVSGYIHDFGRLPAREFKEPHIPPGLQPSKIKADGTPSQDTRYEGQNSVVLASKGSRDVNIQQPKPHDEHMDVIKEEEEEEATQSGVPNLHDGHDQERATPPTKSFVKQLSEEWPLFATTGNDESNSKISPLHSDAGRDSSSSECSETGRKRKRGHGLTNECSESTSDIVSLLPESTLHDGHAAPGGEAFARPGPGPDFQTQRPMVDKREPSSMLSHAGDMNPQAAIIKANRRFTGCMNSFMDCCIHLQLYLQQPVQIAALVGRNDEFDSPPSKIFTPTRHSSRSGAPSPATPLGIQHASVQMKLKGNTLHDAFDIYCWLCF